MTLRSERDRIISKAGELATFWAVRNQAIAEMYKILEQVDENKEAGFESTVVPELKVAFDFGVHILSANPVRHSMPLQFHDNETGIERDRKGKGERLLHGAWRSLDARRRGAMLDTVQRSLAGWGLSTGYLSGIAMVRNIQGAPDFFADIWDISEVYPEAGGLDEGLITVVRQYGTTLGEFQRRAARNGWEVAGIKGAAGTKVTVQDYWETRYNSLKPYEPDVLNAVLVQEGERVSASSGIGAAVLVKPLERDENLTRIPVFLYPVNGMPTPAAYYGMSQAMSRRMGQSFLETAKITYNTLNRLYKHVLNDVKAAASRVYKETNLSGEVSFDPQVFMAMLNVLAKRPGENLELLPQTTAIASGAQLIQDMRLSLERAAGAYTLFGQTQTSLSGVAIERLNEQAKGVLGPALQGMRAFYQDVDYFWLQQYRRMAGRGILTKPFRAAGRMSGMTENSGYFDESFTVDDIPDTHYVEVKIRESLPLDMQIKANTASMLRPGEKQVPLEWVMEHILEVDDPGALIRATREEVAGDLPQVQIAHAINGLLDRAEAAQRRGGEKGQRLAEALLAAAESLTQQLAQMGMQQPGQQQSPQPGMAPTGPQPQSNGRGTVINLGGRPAGGA